MQHAVLMRRIDMLTPIFYNPVYSLFAHEEADFYIAGKRPLCNPWVPRIKKETE
jgi:hypothetical protein